MTSLPQARSNHGQSGAKSHLLEVRDLVIEVGQKHNRSKVVDGVSFDLDEGEVLGVAGESGSGKTMTALSLVGLLPRGASVTGSVRFRGEELVGAANKQLRRIRGHEIGFIFQEPMSSLHPAKRAGNQVAEVIRVHERVQRKVARSRAIEMLRLAGISDAEARAKQYPHELSGGLQQRVGIAISLAGRPSLLIADEPTTALDTTVQAQVMDRIKMLKDEFGLAIVFITHDLGLISQLSKRVVVMYSGQIVEEGPIAEVFRVPHHPYTESLLNAVIRPGLAVKPKLSRDSDRPSVTMPVGGCRFASRCPYVEEVCTAEVPVLGAIGSGSATRCIRHLELTLVGVEADK